MIASSDKPMLLRFTCAQRLFHLSVILIFMLLSVTGLAWMYAETPWGQGIIALFGGYSNTIYIHRITGLLMLAGFAANIIYLIFQIDWKDLRKSFLGPDSMVFQWGDVREFLQQAGWLVGLNKEPCFDRWSWWEKFDYWAVWWGLVIVGVTGLLIYDPVLSSEYVPGWFYNVALWVHRIEALLAMGHIFTVHFFIEHFRPSNFPFSPTMFTGSMKLEHARKEHSAWVKRLEREGKLQERLTAAPPLPVRILHLFFGYSMILLGVFLLVFGLINAVALRFFGA